MASRQEIKDWFAANPGASHKDIYRAMVANGVTPETLWAAMKDQGWKLDEVQAIYHDIENNLQDNFYDDLGHDEYSQLYDQAKNQRMAMQPQQFEAGAMQDQAQENMDWMMRNNGPGSDSNFFNKLRDFTSDAIPYGIAGAAGYGAYENLVNYLAGEGATNAVLGVDSVNSMLAGGGAGLIAAETMGGESAPVIGGVNEAAESGIFDGLDLGDLSGEDWVSILSGLTTINAGNDAADTAREVSQDQAYAIDQASKTQAQGSADALSRVNQMFGWATDQTEPFVDAGIGAIPTVQQGATPQGLEERLNMIINSPLFQEMKDTRMGDAQDMLSAGGLMRSGDALHEVSRITPELAFEIDNIIQNRASSLMGMGGNIAMNNTGVTPQAAGLVSELIQSGPNSLAAGQLDAAGVNAQGHLAASQAKTGTWQNVLNLLASRA